MADLLDRILDRVAALAPSVSGDVLMRVEVEVRAEIGGTDGGYIARRLALQRSFKLGQQLRSGATLRQAIEAAGIQKSHGYAILARPLRRRV